MGVSTPVVRPMTPADVAAVAELEVTSFADPWPPSMFFEELSLPGRAYVVVEDGGHVAAYGGIMLVDQDAHVMTIAVHPTRRREGLGTRVMLALFDAALEGGARHLTLEVRESNEAATALYQRFGFTAVGRRHRYYQDDEDAIIMWAIDADGFESRRRMDLIREQA
jgi:[ribosomal protein S18]-alanine N-acetyltransferase